jgi:hypothetical protein
MIVSHCPTTMIGPDGDSTIFNHPLHFLLRIFKPNIKTWQFSFYNSTPFISGD